MEEKAEPTQKGPSKAKRIRSFDLARGLAILFMIFQHCVLMYGTEEMSEEIPGATLYILGTAPAAPVFMFLMGVFFVYPGSKSLEENLLRGVKLLILGYILNILRFVLPTLVLLGAGLTSSEDLGSEGPQELFLVLDILQFAGLAYIIMALLRHKAKDDTKVYLAVAALVMVVSPLLWGTGTDHPLFGQLLRPLWGEDSGAFFTLFPWLLFPLLGMVFGIRLNTGEGIQELSRKGLKPGLVAMVLGGVLSIIALGTSVEYQAVGEYPLAGVTLSLFLVGFVLVWLWLCEMVVDRVPGRIFDILLFWSRSITTIYFIQWTLIGWGIFLLGSEEQGLGVVLVSIVIVTGLSHVIAERYLEFKRSDRFPGFLRLLV